MRSSNLSMIRQYCHSNTASWQEKKKIMLSSGGENECEYKDRDRRLKEKLINGNNDAMMTEIIKDLTAMKRENEKTSVKVFSWARRGETQRAQKAIIDTTKESREFDMIRKEKRS